MEEPLVDILELIAHMDENRPLDIQTLGRWLEENKVSRTELASFLGLARSTIDNYFSSSFILGSTKWILS